VRPRVGVGLCLGQALVGRAAGPAGSRARGLVRCETGRRGKGRGFGWAAALVGPSRPRTREQARSKGGWVGLVRLLGPDAPFLFPLSSFPFLFLISILLYAMGFSHWNTWVANTFTS